MSYSIKRCFSWVFFLFFHPDLRKQARQLENELDLKLVSFSKLCTSYSSSSSSKDQRTRDSRSTDKTHFTLAMWMYSLLSLDIEINWVFIVIVCMTECFYFTWTSTLLSFLFFPWIRTGSVDSSQDNMLVAMTTELEQQLANVSEISHIYDGI